MNNKTHSTVENFLQFLKWRPCILGILIGCVCTSILGLSIGLIVYPYLLLKDQKLCETEIQWNKCSKDCGNGTQYGFKINRKDVNGKCVITSNISIERSCDNGDACPVDGGWGQWKTLGSCSVTCGTGLVTTVRKCDNPVPSNNGKYCVGEHYKLGTCSENQCADSYPARKVAFHALLSRDTSLDSGQTVIFDKVITNVGDAYNNKNGIFTAPVDGIYVFISTFLKVNEAKALHVHITKNRQTVSRGHATYGNAWNEGSMNAVLVLDKNDQVTVSHMNGYGKEESMAGRWCYFSGYLLM